MTQKVHKTGHIVIPKRIRDRLGIKPGDEVRFVAREHHLEIHKATWTRDSERQSSSIASPD